MTKTIAIIGLGYVGLPLALAFAKQHQVVGFDINADRIAELKAGIDTTRETTTKSLQAAHNLEFTSDKADLSEAQIYIITVPTPVDETNQPDMIPLLSASKLVGSVLGVGDIVVYESTVYPGATEEICVPELEAYSGLTFNKDFYCGYSPERINPGDKTHRLETIIKVTSGSTDAIADEIDALYSNIITAGTHKASSIAVAEAAKVIENTQRDINIALMNELSLIFNKMGLDTIEVLEAAGTKWNFLPFRPGLVGGHCIGVDPYYLTYKAQALGYHPEMILAGRSINDSMASHVADETVKEMLRRDVPVKGSRVLVMGLTFKENCPDLRNSKVFDVVKTLQSYGAKIDLHDPEADLEEAEQKYGQPVLRALEEDEQGLYDAIILAVPHQSYQNLSAEVVISLGRRNAVIFDIKGCLGNIDGVLRL